MQIHVGGVYGDKEKSMRRFVERFEKLDEAVKGRLVVENDDRRFSLRDCLQISAEAAVPVLFDVFHHEVNNFGETIKESFGLFTKNWKEEDGLPTVDYGSQRKGEREGQHI